MDIVKLERMIKNLKEEICRDDSTVKKDLLISYQVKLQQLKDVSLFSLVMLIHNVQCCHDNIIINVAPTILIVAPSL